MQWFNKFPAVKQFDEMDCGPTCLQIICRFYKKQYALDYLRQICNTTRAGSSLLGLKEAAELIGFSATGIQIAFEEIDETMLPCVAYWQQKHFIVLYKIENDKVFVSDPAIGLLTHSKKDFLTGWSNDGENGILLVLEVPEHFFDEKKTEPLHKPSFGLQKLFSYLKGYKKTVLVLLGLLLLIGVAQLAFPVITQRLVDKGIGQQNLPYIYALLLAQFLFFMGRTVTEIFNSYTLLKLGTRLNIRLVSEFFEKLFRLPLGFFDVKMSGDILQRIHDHSRIEYFLTHGALNIFISVLNLILFGAILCWYNPQLFLVFFIGSCLYFFWFRYFMKKKAELDYKNFSKLSERQDKNLEMIFGMPEIKLNNAAGLKKAQWESLQEEVFRINYKTLKVTQWQQTGARVINEIKNISITFLSALLVVHHQISFGEMMAISYISGQLNVPVSGILDFLQEYQDARLSGQRIHEIHEKKDESANIQQPESHLPETGDIVIRDLCFQYEKSQYSKPIVNNINLVIPEKKITAIVGQSGCGKTTLLKLLLKFYEPVAGSICIGSTPLSSIPHAEWRKHCGTVLQDAYIFNDTIAANICLNEERPDSVLLNKAVEISFLKEVITKLPLGLYTKIGGNGMQLSGGEKQRVLIARAVYHNPDFIFLDEATSSLDAINEQLIVQNLERFFKNKTVVVIAHRLSTVQHAHQIIVMEAGTIVETGTHTGLIQKNGTYSKLVKNQLQ
jgi:ATP-binding cassette subfamily B protein